MERRQATRKAGFRNRPVEAEVADVEVAALFQKPSQTEGDGDVEALPFRVAVGRDTEEGGSLQGRMVCGMRPAG